MPTKFLMVAVALTLTLAATPAVATAQAPDYPTLDDAFWAIPAATPGADLTAALAAAKEHWGGDPPCGTPRVRFIPYWPGGGVWWGHLCTADIERQFADFDSLCNLLTHEFGHGHGWEHPPLAPLDPTQVGGVMDYATMDDKGAVPACDRERDRRDRLEVRWFALSDSATARRTLCRKLRRRHASAAPRRCGQARATTLRARALRRTITWPLW